MPEFEHQDAVGCEQARRVGCDGAIAIEAVGAAIECAPRIEVAHFGLQPRNVGPRHVRGIGNEDIDRRPQSSPTRTPPGGPL